MPQKPWNAKWIAYAYSPEDDLGVFAFERDFAMLEVPETFTIRVSADQRYKMFINREMVSFGPQRGDPKHWFFETIDIAPYLKHGSNTIRVLVWNFGYWAPMAQHSVRTGFVFEGDGISTPDGWRVAKLNFWSYHMMYAGKGEFYIDVGPGELIAGGSYPWTFMETEFRRPHVICDAEPRGALGGGTPWMLVPRTIPPMKYEQLPRGAKVVRGFKGDHRAKAPVAGTRLWIEEDEHQLDILIDKRKPLVMDFEELICGYLKLVFEGEATITVTYDESLWNEDGTKGDRHSVAGKVSVGYQDQFDVLSFPRLGEFEPLWWRTFRYVKIESDRPTYLRQSDVHVTGYPIIAESSFEADDPWVKPIWDVSLRTVERCAGETYFDCPYYEQLQYAGDTRIQALIGYYLERDRDLQRNAIRQFGWSLMENGLTQSRYPSRQAQVIPPFSLWWIIMLSDQRLYDDVGLRPLEQATRITRIQSAFATLREQPEESFWNFGDWVPGWHWGVPPGGATATMHQLTESLGYFLHLPVPFDGHDDDERTQRRVSEMLKLELETLYQSYEKVNGLVRSVGDLNWQPSEHSEALYRLCQMALGVEPDPWPYASLERENAAKTTYYFSYYKHLAMRPDDYLAQLGPWKEMIENGLTTFAENPEPVRSDCHAWSAHPILGFFQLIAGVTSIAPGWQVARIEPKPGSLRWFDARIAHPVDDLRVQYEDDRLSIETPVPAELHWKGRKQMLEPGSHRI